MACSFLVSRIGAFSFYVNAIQLTTHASLEVKSPSSIMIRIIILLLFITYSGFSQPYYTRLRAAFTAEGMGIAPVAMFSADVPLVYRDKSILNAQVGIGISGRLFYYMSPTLSSSITHNFLFNPFHKSLCKPDPNYKQWEYYGEMGLGLSIFNPIYGAALPGKLYKYSYLSPTGILGLRIHLVREKWIHIFKFRFTPFLDRKFVPWYGFGLGLGWR